MRVFAAEYGVHPRRFSLQTQGFNIVGTGHQIGFRRQFVSGMAPIGIGERTELATIDKGLKASAL